MTLVKSLHSNTFNNNLPIITGRVHQGQGALEKGQLAPSHESKMRYTCNVVEELINKNLDQKQKTTKSKIKNVNLKF